MTTAILGRLVSVDLREIWLNEAGDFTPWLAKPENLELLGDALDLELELEGTEQEVGPFKADIICRDLSSGSDALVLIENQLEKTDHSHLGQLLTYMAGLHAKTIIWVAARFTEEHRAALDMLNEITTSEYKFFGLEVELWRIGQSEAAPKFNIISKPNEWSRRGTSASGPIDVTPTKALQQRYWTFLRQYLIDHKSPVKPTKPLPQHWMNFAIGRAFFGMVATVNTQQKQTGVQVSMYGQFAKAHFNLLLQDKAAIECEFGQALTWEELPGKTESRIVLRKPGFYLPDESTWEAQAGWMAEMLERFNKVFRPRIQDLEAELWQSSSETVSAAQ